MLSVAELIQSVYQNNSQVAKVTFVTVRSASNRQNNFIIILMREHQKPI